MTHFRKMMLEELQRRNYAETTIGCYLCAVEDFSRHFNCSPDCLGSTHMRGYQAELFRKRKFSPKTVAQRLAALRFFYTQTLKNAWSIEDTDSRGNTSDMCNDGGQEKQGETLYDSNGPSHLYRMLFGLGLCQLCLGDAFLDGSFTGRSIRQCDFHMPNERQGIALKFRKAI